MTPTLETRVPITLQGKKYEMVFDANTMCAYETATGKFFLDTVAVLYDVMKPVFDARMKAKDLESRREAGEVVTEEAPHISYMTILRKISMNDLTALVWAAVHTYKNDEPVWPLTLPQMRKQIKPQDVPWLFTAFLRGQVSNTPSKEEMGESTASPKVQEGAIIEDGGERGIELPQDAFA